MRRLPLWMSKSHSCSSAKSTVLGTPELSHSILVANHTFTRERTSWFRTDSVFHNKTGVGFELFKQALHMHDLKDAEPPANFSFPAATLLRAHLKAGWEVLR
jgi:hypothetical protein